MGDESERAVEMKSRALTDSGQGWGLAASAGK